MEEKELTANSCQNINLECNSINSTTATIQLQTISNLNCKQDEENAKDQDSKNKLDGEQNEHSLECKFTQIEGSNRQLWDRVHQLEIRFGSLNDEISLLKDRQKPNSTTESNDNASENQKTSNDENEINIARRIDRMESRLNSYEQRQSELYQNIDKLNSFITNEQRERLDLMEKFTYMNDSNQLMQMKLFSLESKLKHVNQSSGSNSPSSPKLPSAPNWSQMSIPSLVLNCPIEDNDDETKCLTAQMQKTKLTATVMPIKSDNDL
ncbi:hypothetical protein BLOT_010325 [Blomia tropicalis]|nr:hypothetical protein BLOT_010325 [Blomia tropicalis]